MPDIAPGLTATRELIVEEKHCTERSGYHIYSTPELVLLIELTAIDALAPCLTDARSSVGSTVSIAHTAAAPKGQRLVSTVTVREVDRRRIGFEVDVRDEIDTVANGRHERFIIDLDHFGTRLADKAARVTSGADARTRDDKRSG